MDSKFLLFLVVLIAGFFMISNQYSGRATSINYLTMPAPPLVPDALPFRDTFFVEEDIMDACDYLEANRAYFQKAIAGQEYDPWKLDSLFREKCTSSPFANAIVVALQRRTAGGA